LPLRYSEDQFGTADARSPRRVTAAIEKFSESLIDLQSFSRLRCAHVCGSGLCNRVPVLKPATNVGQGLGAGQRQAEIFPGVLNRPMRIFWFVFSAMDLSLFHFVGGDGAAVGLVQRCGGSRQPSSGDTLEACAGFFESDLGAGGWRGVG
jgi:hypothetical protein